MFHSDRLGLLWPHYMSLIPLCLSYDGYPYLTCFQLYAYLLDDINAFEDYYDFHVLNFRSSLHILRDMSFYSAFMIGDGKLLTNAHCVEHDTQVIIQSDNSISSHFYFTLICYYLFSAGPFWFKVELLAVEDELVEISTDIDIPLVFSMI